ncbi:MAG TPA: hypothetical protein VFX15_02755 [Actinomycetes bacterium]|nr:hypothetical protein [Actinomycetes bacterium]
MIWLDEPYPVRLASGFEALIHGFYVTFAPNQVLRQSLCVMLVDEEGVLSGLPVDELGIELPWRYDRQARKWVNTELAET